MEGKIPRQIWAPHTTPAGLIILRKAKVKRFRDWENRKKQYWVHFDFMPADDTVAVDEDEVGKTHEECKRKVIHKLTQELERIANNIRTLNADF